MATRVFRPETAAAAIDAAANAALCLGMGCPDPVLLHASQHVSVRLFPSGPVARVVRNDSHSVRKLCRELDVAHHLAARGAPAVRLCGTIPPGPYSLDGHAMTLWEFVTHIPADSDNSVHVEQALATLLRVHEALGDFPGELPDFWAKIDECRDLLRSQAMLPLLDCEDRQFLEEIYERLSVSLARLPLNRVPIHGDAHPGNVLITPHGALWNDFEGVCLGPREWDMGWWLVGEAGRSSVRRAGIDAAAGLDSANGNALVMLGYLRSFCVCVWCWNLADIPEKRKAAEFHLGYLKEQASEGKIR